MAMITMVVLQGRVMLARTMLMNIMVMATIKISVMLIVTRIIPRA